MAKHPESTWQELSRRESSSFWPERRYDSRALENDKPLHPSRSLWSPRLSEIMAHCALDHIRTCEGQLGILKFGTVSQTTWKPDEYSERAVMELWKWQDVSRARHILEYSIANEYSTGEEGASRYITRMASITRYGGL